MTVTIDDFYFEKMTPEQWAQIPDNRIQRDTVRHAVKVIKNFQEIISTHLMVEAAIFPDGSLVKLDGHTRSLLWEQGRAPVPDFILVKIHKVFSLQKADYLYRTIDSRSAVDSAGDDIFGILKKKNFTGSSKIVKQGRLSLCLKVVEWARTGQAPANSIDKEAAIDQWFREIVFSDEIVTGGGGGAKVYAGIFAAMMLSVQKHGKENAAAFWRLYLSKKEEGLDATNPVIKLRLHMSDRKRDARTASMKNSREITENAIFAVHQWLRGRPIKRIRGYDLVTYLDRSLTYSKRWNQKWYGYEPELSEEQTSMFPLAASDFEPDKS